MQVLMPKYGETVDYCTILNWRKREGDTVTEGDVLCEVEANKAAFEVESNANGILLKLYYNAGDDVPTLAPIAVVGKKGEQVPKLETAPDHGSTPSSPALPGSIDGRAGEVHEYPVRGARKIIAEKMTTSLQTTAQFTMHVSADARSILSYQEKLKNSKHKRKLRDITVNDLVQYAAIKTLKSFPALNAHFLGDRIVEFSSVHAGFAVDTETGVMVPVIRFADRLSLKELSAETARLSKLCIYGGIEPDDLSGGTVTLTNLGALGIEMFTPILHPPQAAILGICDIQKKPVGLGNETEFHPHIGLSLTVDHRAVDGAPAARYLKALCETIAGFELLLAG